MLSDGGTRTLMGAARPLIRGPRLPAPTRTVVRRRTRLAKELQLPTPTVVRPLTKKDRVRPQRRTAREAARLTSQEREPPLRTAMAVLLTTRRARARPPQLTRTAVAQRTMPG